MKSRTKKYVDKDHQYEMLRRQSDRKKRQPTYVIMGSSKYSPNKLPNYRKSQRGK